MEQIPMTGLWQDLRFALRMLRKSPGFTAIAVVTLALGMGACTVMFSVYQNLMFNAFAAKAPSRLIVPVIKIAGGSGQGEGRWLECSPENFDAIHALFEDIVCYRGTPVLLSDGRDTRQVDGGYVTANAFDFYGVPPLLGRGIVPEDGKSDAPPVFVMSYSTWKGEFNMDPQMLGKRFTVNDEPRTLVGIMPPRFQAFGSLTRIWMPMDIHDAGNHNFINFILFGRLKPGAAIAEASAKLDVVVRQLAKDRPNAFPKNFTVRVQSASDFLLGPYGIGSPVFSLKHAMYGLLACSVILLLIACSNVANLLLARATKRENEIAARITLGASRGRLIQLLWAESSMLVAAACVLGCVFAYAGLKGLTLILPHKHSFTGNEVVLGLDREFFLLTLCITAVVTLLCGLAPALRATGTNLQPQLAGSASGMGSSLRHGRIRASLVVSQVALSIVLLTSAGLAIRTVFLLTHVALGFNSRNIFLAAIRPAVTSRVAQDQLLLTGTLLNQKAAQALSTLPGVEEVAIDNTIPGYLGGRGSQVTTPGSSRSEGAGLDPCSETLLQTLGLRMFSGRWLSKADVDSALYVTVVNQTMARRLWGDENPIGLQLEVKSFQTHGQPPHDVHFQVIGVVHDIRNAGPEQPVLPEAFIPYTIQGAGRNLLLKTKVDPDSLLHSIEERVWTVEPAATFVLAESLDDFMNVESYSTPKFAGMTLAPVAGIAMLLVMSGIFSVLAYTVSLQTHEIGVRMALGAQQGEVLRMILLKGLRLVAMGVSVGLCASFGLTRFLASQIWGISPNDPWTFSVVVALIAVAALAACWIPARRAALVDPIVALRYE
jgi:putative ABC transport system permease protein